MDYFKIKYNRIKHNIYLLSYKQIDVNKMNIDSLVISSSQVSYFPLSMNTIKILNTSNGIYYFRECRRHLPFREFIDNQIDSFADLALKEISLDNFLQEIPFRTHFSEDEVNCFLLSLNKCKLSASFYDKIKKMDFYLKKEFFSPWKKKIKISREAMAKIGLDCIPDSCVDILSYFFLYINSSIVSYLFHDFIPIGQYETFSASRSIATYILAKKIGLERLVTPCKMIKLIIDGKTEYGVLCERAPGVRALDSNFEITPSLQRELNNLHLLDVICYQTDHFANNYNIINGEANETSVCAFDNDMDKTFFPALNVCFEAAYGGSAYVRDGEINRAHVDVKTYEKMKQLDFADLEVVLSPYLNKLQIFCLKIRIKKLLKAIKNSVQLNSSFLIDEYQWTESSVAEELKGKYGMTYLVQYKNKEDINSSFLNKK